jgi:gas vesicle protein
MSNCESNFSSRTLIFSVFLGALAGAAAVLLLAPRVRRESAERIRELSHDLKERASAAVDTAGEGISSAVSHGREYLDEKRSVIAAAVAPGAETSARRRL